jgi:hypothetical protein
LRLPLQQDPVRAFYGFGASQASLLRTRTTA